MKNKAVLYILLLIGLPIWANDNNIENLKDYFEYLPNKVHQSWEPYKANSDYEVVVQFRVSKNGKISKPEIVKSSNVKANQAVIDAVYKASPFEPLPNNFTMDSVKAQVELKYIK